MQMLSWIWYLSRLGLFSMRQRQLKGRFKYWQDWKDPSVAFYFQLVEIHQSCINYKNVYLIPKIQFPLIFTLSIIHEFELNKFKSSSLQVCREKRIEKNHNFTLQPFFIIFTSTTSTWSGHHSRGPTNVPKQHADHSHSNMGSCNKLHTSVL